MGKFEKRLFDSNISNSEIFLLCGFKINLMHDGKCISKENKVSNKVSSLAKRFKLISQASGYYY